MSASKIPKLTLRYHAYSGDGRAAWLVIHDPYAGLPHVYTVYRITLTGNKAAHVIGRELTLPFARETIKRDMEILR